MRKLLSLAIACLALAAISCQDPGCIRHSQCKSGYECRSNKCQPRESASGGSSGAAAATTAGSGSVPVRNNMSNAGAGAAAGASGQAAPDMSAAGSAGSM